MALSLVPGGLLLARAKMQELGCVALVDYHACRRQNLVSAPKFSCCDKGRTTPETQHQSLADLGFRAERLALLDQTGCVTTAVTCSNASCRATCMQHVILPSVCPACLRDLPTLDLPA